MTFDNDMEILQNTKENIDWEGPSWVVKQFSHPERTIRLATSFSGIGAIEYALQRLGLKTEIVFAGDIDKNCKTTYFANYNIKEDNWHTDIRLFNAKPYKGKVDLFVGGAPCQAFSIVGDQQKDMKMTYLFDAKYRIEGRVNGVDTPPEDAINQMHRYRDAIYYKEHSSKELKKEVIGGYILFPGDGQKADVEVSKFYKTIEEVNIGAFPLRPKDIENRELLVQFIKSLIGKASTEILDDSIPQKGLYYTHDEPKDAVYMILSLDEEVNQDVDAVLEGRASTIIMGRKGMEETKDIQSVRYIAPIIPGGHIEGYYKVAKANLAHVDNEKYPIRIKFDIADWQELQQPARFGMARAAYRGYCKTRDEFFQLCREQMIIDKL